jgi:tetratricopeptide (TPR) repeat protein
MTLYDLEDTAGLPLLARAAREDPYAHGARIRLADHALKSGDLDTAERIFEEVRAVNPHDSVPWMGLAEVARQREDYETALRLAREGVSRWSVDANSLLLYGALLAQLGDIDAGEEIVLRALRIDPELAIGHDLLARIRALRQ